MGEVTIPNSISQEPFTKTEAVPGAPTVGFYHGDLAVLRIHKVLLRMMQWLRSWHRVSAQKIQAMNEKKKKGRKRHVPLN